jgi:probable rRNA maturation factor
MNDPSGQPPAEPSGLPTGSQQTSKPMSRGSLAVYAANEQTDVEIDVARWMRLAEQVLEAEGVLAPGLDVEVSLLFVDVPTISNLNHQFMGKTGPTDVLSFPIDDPRDEQISGPPIGGSPFAINIDVDGERADFLEDEDTDSDAPSLLGDVLICASVAAANALEHRGPNHDGSLEDELALLVVHGLLHLLGMDHQKDAEAEFMEAREQELLTEFHRTPTTNGQP